MSSSTLKFSNARESVFLFLRQWWPPALRRALHDWQQTCDEQEWELAELRGRAQAVVNSFDRNPTKECVNDVVGLAESLRRYREMVHGKKAKASIPRSGRGAA
jgi:hypothetical protein